MQKTLMFDCSEFFFQLQDGSIRIAVFIPSIKDKPASIKVFSLGFTTATPVSIR